MRTIDHTPFPTRQGPCLALMVNRPSIAVIAETPQGAYVLHLPEDDCGWVHGDIRDAFNKAGVRLNGPLVP